MPGIVVFRRRWSVGSDDLVVPGVFLFTMHLVWVIVLSTLLAMVHFDRTQQCVLQLWQFLLGYLVLLAVSLLIEAAICAVAMRGSILDTAPRASMQYILYVRIVIMLLEAALLVVGVLWLVYNYNKCPIEGAKETLLGLVVCNWCVLVSVLITVWCTYDSAGRSWVKMKQFQRSMRESESKYQYKRSGNTNRNWRQRKVIRAYQDSWDQRCRFLFCCMRPSDRNRNSFADIARLLSDFFRDLDVVPSDVVAGLVLLRKFQKIEQKAIVEQRKDDTYEFLSGVAITARTQFLALHEAAEEQLFQTVIRYMHFALGAYGWPVFVMTYSATGICQLCTKFRCCCVPCCGAKDSTEVIEDNCCRCNYAALQKILSIGNIEIVYATYHVDVGETPFYVAIDYDRRKVVISIRGTLSMKDVLTDLNAEGETLPLNPPKEDWTGHKGMVQAAVYIRDKLSSENLLQKAFEHNPEKGTRDFGLVLVGHSLGAGAASILAILLKQEYADLQCFSYSPPGGLLSMPAVEYTKSFIVSVVLGKDVVPRIGLHQMEALRADLINAIKRSVDPKWKTITCNLICCGCGPQPTSAHTLSATDANIAEYMQAKEGARAMSVHPSDSTIALTLHHPLYPPGRIIHIVRHHPKKGEQAISNHDPVYQALWAQNTDFDEVLISPVMIQDHMPDKVLEALNKVVTTFGPRKPQRQLSSPPPDSDPERCQLLETQGSPKSLHSTNKLCLETSFTSLQSPSEALPSSLNSSTNGYHSSRSQNSPIQLTSILTILDEKLKQKSLERRHMALNLRKVDLIYDDWYGLAPLASPESLSEVSSISSKASAVFHIDPFGELKTPKILRRTPKIPGNLSTCADDLRSVRYFQKLSQNSKVRCPSQAGSYSSSDLSYESATSVSRCCSNLEEHYVETRCCGIQEENIVAEMHQEYASMDSDSFRSADNMLGTPKTQPYQLGEVIGTVYEDVEQTLDSAPTPPPRFCTNVDTAKSKRPSDLFSESSTSDQTSRDTTCYSSCSPDHSKNPDENFFYNCPDRSNSASFTNSLSFPSNSSTIQSSSSFNSSSVVPTKIFPNLGEISRRIPQLTITPGCRIDQLDRPTTSQFNKNGMYRSRNVKEPGRPEIPAKPDLRGIARGKMVYMETHFDEDLFNSSSSSLVSKDSSRSPRSGLDIKSCLIRGTRTSSECSSTPQVVSPSTPQELDPDMISNFAIDLNLEEENRSMHFYNPNFLQKDNTSKPNSIDSGSICRTPSDTKNVTFNPQVVNIDPKFVYSAVSNEASPTRFERWKTKKSELWQLLPGRSRKPKAARQPTRQPARQPDAGTSKVHAHCDEPCFSKNESLPLLSGLGGTQTSPNFVRRKKYVYPITSVARGESSV